MDQFKSKKGGRQDGPESIIQDSIIAALRNREWLVKPTHGNMYQMGFPDLFCAHVSYGIRWVEVKNPEAYRFTPAQLEWFPQFSGAGVGIWVLISASTIELNKLMGPPNWHTYLKL